MNHTTSLYILYYSWIFHKIIEDPHYRTFVKSVNVPCSLELRKKSLDRYSISGVEIIVLNIRVQLFLHPEDLARNMEMLLFRRLF